MREVGAFEAKNRLGQLLDLVEQGEEVTITRHGKAIARLAPLRTTHDREQARAANLARPFWFALLPQRFVRTSTTRSFLRTHC